MFFFYFMLKFLYALEIFTFLSRFFGFEENWLNKNVEVNSKTHDVTDWTSHN